MDEDDAIRQDFEGVLDDLRVTIDRRGFSPRMKEALKLVLNGESYRSAAERTGVGYREVYRNAASIGELRDAHKLMWLELWGDDFPPLWQHHLEEPQDEQPAS